MQKIKGYSIYYKRKIVTKSKNKNRAISTREKIGEAQKVKMHKKDIKYGGKMSKK